jgi:hypothetical protein
LRAVELFDRLAEHGEDESVARGLEGWKPLAVPIAPIGRAELQRYLQSLASVDLRIRAVIDDGRPGESARIGPVRAENGTVLEAQLVFERSPGAPEAELRKLSIKPSRPAKMLGPLLSFDRIFLDEKSRLCFQLKVLGGNEEIILESVHRDDSGALVFEVAGKGFLAKLATDIRITQSRKVQYYSRGFLWLDVGWLGAGWKDLAIGDPVIVEADIPIKSWPPRASELLDWLPDPAPKTEKTAQASGPQSAQGSPGAQGPQKAQLDIPVKDLSIHFVLQGSPSKYDFSDKTIQLELEQHQLEIESHGYFEGRTYHPHAVRPSTFRGTLGGHGRLADPSTRGKLDRAKLSFEGRYSAILPFDALDNLDVEASAEVSVDLATRELAVHFPDELSIEAPGGTSLSIATSGSVRLLPGNPDPAKRYTFAIDRRLSTYSFSVEGPLRAEGLLAPGEKTALARLENLPPSTLPGVSDEAALLPSLLSVRGLFGYEEGCFVTRAEVDAALRTDSLFVLRAPETAEATLSIPAGAWVAVDAVATFALEHAKLPSAADVALGGASLYKNALAAQIRGQLRTGGTIEAVKIRAPDLAADVPGRAPFEARLSGEGRFGESGFDLSRVRAVVRATVERGTAGVAIEPENAPRLSARLREGSWLQLDSGDLVPTALAPLELSTNGYASGARSGRLRAHLAVDDFEFQDRSVLLEIGRGTIIDLTGPLAFRLRPEQVPKFNMSCEATIDLDYPKGAGVAVKPVKGLRLLEFGGPTRAKVESVLAVEL